MSPIGPGLWYPPESGPTNQDYKESQRMGPTDSLKGIQWYYSESSPTTQDNKESLRVGPTNLLKGVPLDQDHGTPLNPAPQPVQLYRRV